MCFGREAEAVSACRKPAVEHFLASVAEATEKGRVTARIETYVTASPSPDEREILAWVFIPRIFARPVRFKIGTHCLFLNDAPPLVVKHIAYHEVCHVIRKDPHKRIPSNDGMEQAVERCVLTLVGQAQYRAFIKAYQNWMPKDADLWASRVTLLRTDLIRIDKKR